MYDPTTAFVQATMDERLRRAELVRTARALRREARAAAKAEIATTVSTRTPARATVTSTGTHRHPWLWSLTHFGHA